MISNMNFQTFMRRRLVKGIKPYRKASNRKESTSLKHSAKHFENLEDRKTFFRILHETFYQMVSAIVLKHVVKHLL